MFAELGIAVESKGAAAAADAAGEGKKKKKNKKKEGEAEGAQQAAAAEEPSEEPSEDPADESAGPVDPAAVRTWRCISQAMGAPGGFLALFVGGGRLSGQLGTGWGTLVYTSWRRAALGFLGPQGRLWECCGTFRRNPDALNACAFLAAYESTTGGPERVRLEGTARGT